LQAGRVDTPARFDENGKKFAWLLYAFVFLPS
jgi:hypothetical protein